jgi:two-component system response regulator YesN
MYRVLIIDDEKIIRSGLEKGLPWSALGLQVIGTAADGIEGERFIREFSPDIVITDIKMPGKNGLDMLRDLENQKMPKIVLMTGFEEFEYARAAVDLRVDKMFLKPVNDAELTEALRGIAEDLRKQYERDRRVEESRSLARQALALAAGGTGERSGGKMTELLEALRRGDRKTLQKCWRGIEASFDREHGPDDYRITVLQTAHLIFRDYETMTGSRHNALKDAFQRLGAAILEKNRRADIFAAGWEFVESLLGYREHDCLSQSALIIRRAVDYIEENYRNGMISLPEVAGRVYASPSYLSFLFKKEQGMSFTDYLTRVRINEAKKLLQTTELKVAEVAVRAGYSNPQYFNYCFKKQTGYSPFQYKNRKEH